jgi:hypothetical protein
VTIIFKRLFRLLKQINNFQIGGINFLSKVIFYMNFNSKYVLPIEPRPNMPNVEPRKDFPVANFSSKILDHSTVFAKFAASVIRLDILRIKPIVYSATES